jgi:hypothetical protein
MQADDVIYVTSATIFLDCPRTLRDCGRMPARSGIATHDVFATRD